MGENEIDTILFLTNDDNRLTLWFYDRIIEPYILRPLIPVIEKLTTLVQWLIDHT